MISRRRILLSLLFLLLMIGGFSLYRTPEPTPVAVSTTVIPAQNCVAGIMQFPAEGFSAWFPCSPTRTVSKANTPFGQIEVITYQVEVDGFNYAAAYVNYEKLVAESVFDVAKNVILDGAKRSVTRGQPVTDPASRAIRRGEMEGSEIIAFGVEKKLVGRVWLAKRITYQMVVLAPKTLSAERDAMVTQFLDSFALAGR